MQGVGGTVTPEERFAGRPAAGARMPCFERNQVTSPSSERETKGYEPFVRVRDNRSLALGVWGRRRERASKKIERERQEATGYEPFERERERERERNLACGHGVRVRLTQA